MKLFKNTNNGFIVSVSENYGEEIIDISEFNELKSRINSAPVPPNGYTYRLRADNLEWKMVEMPVPEPVEDEANTEDYEQALQQMGVDFSD